MVYLQFDYGEKVCYIKYEKGKSETHGLPYNIYVKSHARLAVTIGGSGGYFLSLKIWIRSEYVTYIGIALLP